MNVNATNRLDATDEEILAGVRRHMSGVEPMLPRPRAWNATAVAVSPPIRTAVRSRIGLAGLVPLVLVMAVVVAAIGYGLGSRMSRPTGLSIGTIPSGAGAIATITYRLDPPKGGEPSSSDLDETVQALANRLGTIFAQPFVAVGSDSWALDASQASGFSVTAEPPDRIVVRYEADYRYDASFFVWNAASIEKWLGRTGRLEFVDLPVAVYGTGGAPGPKEVPQYGATVDPALPALLTRADVATFGSGFSSYSGVTARFDFTPSGTQTFATYSDGSTGHYLALTLDRVVLATTVMSGQGRYGTLQLTTVSAADAVILGWLFENGPHPLPVPLAEIAHAITGPATSRTPGPIVAHPATRPAGIATNGRTLGNANAPHTINIWEDFQCPNCEIFTRDDEPQIVANYVANGKVKIVYHDLLVIDGNTGGTESLDAANAARGASDQGMFWPYHDWLFGNQYSEASGAFTKDRLKTIGQMLGIKDLNTFNSCVDSGSHNSDVTAEASGSGYSSTPTIVIDNGVPLASYDYLTVSAAMDSALGQAALPSPAPTPTATFQTYMVRSGDSMTSIAAAFGIPLATLQAANPQLTDPNGIQVGWVIYVPAPTWNVNPSYGP